MSEYRTWEQRDADAKKTAAEAERIRAEARAATARAEQEEEAGGAQAKTTAMREQLNQAKIAGQLAKTNEDNKAKAKESKDRVREESLNNGTAFKRVVLAVVILGLLASLPGQITYFLGLKASGDSPSASSLLLLSVPFFLELLAVAGVLGTQWAHRRGFPRWPFWILTAILSGFAGAINGTKGVVLFGPVAGIALAATSVMGPLLWEIREYIEARTAGDNRDAAQRARDKAQETRKREAEEVLRKRDAEQDAQRKKLYPSRWKAYELILADHPAGSITRDEAWEDARRATECEEVWKRYVQLLAAEGTARSRDQVWASAWDDVHRMPVGMTASTLAVQVASDKIIDEVLEEAGRTPERAWVELALRDLFPARGDGGDDGEGPPGRAPSGAPKSGPPGTPNVHPSTPSPDTPRGARPGVHVSNETAGHPSRKENRENAPQGSAQGLDEGARKSAREGARKSTRQTSAADTTGRRKLAATGRIGAAGRTRRTPLTDDELDARVRELSPDQPTLSARFVAQHIGCDQARAKEALARTGRLA